MQTNGGGTFCFSDTDHQKRIVQPIFWSRCELELNRCHCLARHRFCNVTDDDDFFQVDDMIAWQPIRVYSPNSPTLNSGTMDCQHIVNVLRTAATVASDNQKQGGLQTLREICHSVCSCHA